MPPQVSRHYRKMDVEESLKRTDGVCVWGGGVHTTEQCRAGCSPELETGLCSWHYAPAPLHTWYSDGIALNIIEQGSAA